MPLAIHLLGPFRVLVDGIPVDDRRWVRRKSKTLVKVLALEPSHQLHKEELIDLLWPEQDREQGLNNLHKILHAARYAIEPDLTAGSASRFLQMRDQLVVLQSAGDLWIDAEAFESQARESLKTRGRELLEGALAIYQGNLLPEDLYEDWAAVRREQLRLLREQTLTQLAVVCEAAGDSNRALDLYKQLIAENSGNEDAHRGAMRLYAALGQRHLAIEQFRICTEALRTDLNTAPEPATADLYAQIVAGAVSRKPEPETAQPPVAPQVEMPRQRLKRRYVAAAVMVMAIAALVMAARRAPNRELQFVAVMPIDAATDSADLGYVADGVTEGIINNLSRLQQVRVMARSTVFRYKSMGLDPIAAGAAMKVRAVLIGKIARSGNNLLVNAELVSVSDGARLWGGRYMATATDLISMPDRIAAEIASGLRLKLTAGDRANLSRQATRDPEAYRLYLQARFFWNQRSKPGFEKSIGLFQAAIDRDPLFARAFAGLADSYGLLGRDDAPTKEYLPKARAAARQALQIDEELAEAHTSMGMLASVYEWNFQEAEREFRRALEIDPSYSTAHHWYGMHLASQGEFKLAEAQLAQAVELDPLSPIITLSSGYPASFQHRDQAAIDAARKALELNPTFPAALENLMIYAERQGRKDEAMQLAGALLRARSQPELAETVESVYRQSGYRAAIRKWTEEEEARAGREWVSPLRIAILAMRAGDLDKAFAWLGRAVEERNPGLVYLNVDPKYDALRADPRLAAVLRRIGLKGRGRSI